MKPRGRLLALAFALSLLPPSGCIHFPKRSPEMKEQLRYLDEHGRTMDGLDLPRTPWAATLITIFPPGAGLYWLGEIGNGLKTTFLFWLIYPWILGPIAAHSQASYENEVFFLEYAKSHGWLEGDQPADAAGPPARPATPAGSPGPEDARPSQSTEAAREFCPQCGKEVTTKDAFCRKCGGKLR